MGYQRIDSPASVLSSTFVAIPAGIADGQVPVYDEGTGLFVAGAGGAAGTRWYVTNTPLDAGFVATLNIGDRFTYPNWGTDPGATYAWDGTQWVYETTLGGPDPVLSDYTAGEANYPDWAASNSGCATSNQVLRLVFFTAKRTETISSLTVYTGGTAAGATPTLVRLGVWTVAADDDLTALVASTASDTTLLAAANTGYTKALSSSWSKVAGTRYAIGLLVVTGATAPQMTGQSISASALLSGQTNKRRKTAALTGQSDLPSTADSGSYVASASHFFVEMAA